MLNIVIPMAGRGSRFVKAGYSIPKPLIPVNGVPMIQVVVSNIKPTRDHRFIFLCLKEHINEYAVDKILKDMEPTCEVVVVDRVTEGAACTVLLAKDLIDGEDPLMIANSDQYVDIGIDDYLAGIDKPGIDGLIMTMWADDPKWSYVGLDADGLVTRVVEKQVISSEATVGIYNYKRGRDFVNSAERMIKEDLRVNGEFYVAPAYNAMISSGSKIAIYNVGRERAGMYGLGIPEDLDWFLENKIGQREAS